MIVSPKTLALAAGLVLVSLAGPLAEDLQPAPPQIPSNFVGRGRYFVPDLNVNVPFSWEGENGNVQMIAGSPDPKHPIHFQNIIFNDAFGSTNLYTITYKWPLPIPTPGECSKIRIGNTGIDLNLVNRFFARSSYVGKEVIYDRGAAFEVNHFRAPLVLPIELDDLPPYPFVLRFPVLEADLYVDRNNPNIFKKVLHFGIHNLYDPDLDEWFVLRRFKRRKGQVTLPEECKDAQAVESILDLARAR